MFSRRAAAFLFFMLFFPLQAQSSEIVFHSYGDALKVSKQEDKPIYVLFGSKDCKWCEKQEEVLLRDSVAAALDSYVLCYVDVSSERNVSKKHKVRPIPTSLILNHDESIIVDKSVGYMDERDFLKWLP